MLERIIASERGDKLQAAARPSGSFQIGRQKAESAAAGGRLSLSAGAKSTDHSSSFVIGMSGLVRAAIAAKIIEGVDQLPDETANPHEPVAGNHSRYYAALQQRRLLLHAYDPLFAVIENLDMVDGRATLLLFLRESDAFKASLRLGGDVLQAMPEPFQRAGNISQEDLHVISESWENKWRRYIA